MDNKFFGSTNLTKWGMFTGDFDLPTQFRISAYVTGDPNDWRGADILAFLTAQRNNPMFTKGYDDSGDNVGTGVTNVNDHNIASAIAFTHIDSLYKTKTGGVVTPYNANMLYETGARVSVNNIWYKSLQDNNKGNTPVSSPTYWQNIDNALGGYFKNPISHVVTQNSIILTGGNYLFSDGTGWATLPPMTKTQGAWAAGTSNGILATGTIAVNTSYVVNVIYNQATRSSDIIILNGGSAPSGWSVVAYLGTVRTTDLSTAFLTGVQTNNIFTYSNPVNNGVEASSGGGSDFIMFISPAAATNSITDMSIMVSGQESNISSWTVIHAITLSNTFSVLNNIQKVSTDVEGSGRRAMIFQTSYFNIRNDGQLLQIRSQILNANNITRNVLAMVNSYTDLDVICY